MPWRSESDNGGSCEVGHYRPWACAHCRALCGRCGCRSVWFDERLQADDGTFLVPDLPSGGGPGTPYTNPDFAIGAGTGLPGCSETGNPGRLLTRLLADNQDEQNRGKTMRLKLVAPLATLSMIVLVDKAY